MTSTDLKNRGKFGLNGYPQQAVFSPPGEEIPKAIPPAPGGRFDGEKNCYYGFILTATANALELVV